MTDQDLSQGTYKQSSMETTVDCKMYPARSALLTKIRTVYCRYTTTTCGDRYLPGDTGLNPTQTSNSGTTMPGEGPWSQQAHQDGIWTTPAEMEFDCTLQACWTQRLGLADANRTEPQGGVGRRGRIGWVCTQLEMPGEENPGRTSHLVRMM